MHCQFADELLRVIGELTVQNTILKKHGGCWCVNSRTRSVELTHQLLAHHSPYSKSQVVCALACARGSLYL